MNTALKRVFWPAVAGFVISSLGLMLLATRHETVGQILVVYPMTMFLYIIPKRLLEHVPESWLFLVGFGSSVGVWTAVLSLAGALIRPVAKRRAVS